jgi:hypothetical protein
MFLTSLSSIELLHQVSPPFFVFDGRLFDHRALLKSLNSEHDDQTYSRAEIEETRQKP